MNIDSIKKYYYYFLVLFLFYIDIKLIFVLIFIYQHRYKKENFRKKFAIKRKSSKFKLLNISNVLHTNEKKKIVKNIKNNLDDLIFSMKNKNKWNNESDIYNNLDIKFKINKLINKNKINLTLFSQNEIEKKWFKENNLSNNNQKINNRKNLSQNLNFVEKKEIENLLKRIQINKTINDPKHSNLWDNNKNDLFIQKNQNKNIFENKEDKKSNLFENKQNNNSNLFEKKEDNKSNLFENKEDKKSNLFENKQNNNSNLFEKKEDNKSNLFENKEDKKSNLFENKQNNNSNLFEKKEDNKNNLFENKQNNNNNLFEKKEDNNSNLFENKEDNNSNIFEKKEDNKSNLFEKKQNNNSNLFDKNNNLNETKNLLLSQNIENNSNFNIKNNKINNENNKNLDKLEENDKIENNNYNYENVIDSFINQNNIYNEIKKNSFQDENLIEELNNKINEIIATLCLTIDDHFLERVKMFVEFLEDKKKNKIFYIYSIERFITNIIIHCLGDYSSNQIKPVYYGAYIRFVNVYVNHFSDVMISLLIRKYPILIGSFPEFDNNYYTYLLKLGFDDKKVEDVNKYTSRELTENLYSISEIENFIDKLNCYSTLFFSIIGFNIKIYKDEDEEHSNYFQLYLDIFELYLKKNPDFYFPIVLNHMILLLYDIYLLNEKWTISLIKKLEKNLLEKLKNYISNEKLVFKVFKDKEIINNFNIEFIKFKENLKDIITDGKIKDKYIKYDEMYRNEEKDN